MRNRITAWWRSCSRTLGESIWEKARARFKKIYRRKRQRETENQKKGDRQKRVQAGESENDINALPSKRENKCEREYQWQSQDKERESSKSTFETAKTNTTKTQTQVLRTHLPSKIRRVMEFFSTFTAWTSHKLYFRLHSDPGMNVIRRRPQPKTSTHALKGICFHNQRHLPPQHKAFASKIHALNGIFQPRPGVTWRFFEF